MDEIIKAVVSIGIAIIGVAILSVLVSPKSQTSKVIQASASGFGNSLAVAMSPVTGEHVRIDTSYPNSGGNIGGFQGGYPELNFGPYLGG